MSFYHEFERYRRTEEKPSAEQLRWTLVFIVSVFESFYKELFAKYIDYGEPYLERAGDMVKARDAISAEALIGLSKKSFSIGDLFAYSLKYNSLTEIRRNYQVLCSCDYLEKLKSFDFEMTRQDRPEIERAIPVLPEIFSSLGKVFVLHHSLVHEYPAMNVSVTLEELLVYLDYGWLLLMLTDRMFWKETGLMNPWHQDIP